MKTTNVNQLTSNLLEVHDKLMERKMNLKEADSISRNAGVIIGANANKLKYNQYQKSLKTIPFFED